MDESFRLAERFISVNGEGRSAGALALFLRFQGCSLRCEWCDTKWAQDENAPCARVTLEDLLQAADDAARKGVRHITLTGGEPLDRPGISRLIAALCQKGFFVEVETNGAVLIDGFRSARKSPGTLSFTMDYKLPSSGMEQYMRKENFAALTESDCVKFVCADKADVLRAKEVARAFDPPCPLFLSPVSGRLHPAELVEIMKAEGMGNFRLGLQLHKIIWGANARGV